MGIYKGLAVVLGMYCLIFIQFGYASSLECLELQTTYSLEGHIIPVTEQESKAVVSGLRDLLNIVKEKSKNQFLDFDKIKRDLSKVKLCVNMANDAVVGSGSRKGSVYFTKERMIVFNSKELLAHDKNSQASLNIIHEFLGALGYPDQNYELTTYFYSIIHTDSFGEETIAIIERTAELYLKNSPMLMENITYAKAGGGVSGVGGGGDTEVVLLKPLVLNFTLMNIDFFSRVAGQKLNPSKFGSYIFSYKIETNGVMKFKIFASSFPFLAYGIIDNKIGIVVDANEWDRLIALGEAGYTQRTKMIKNIVHMILINYLQDGNNEK